MAAAASSASPPLVMPSILPFSVVSYDGSRPSDDDPFPIANVLSPDPALFHCSRDGRNFNLVLQYTPSITSPAALCTVTHIVIHGPGSCTAPVQSGVVFSSLSPPAVASYSSRYDNLTRSEYEQLPLSSLQADGAIAFFTCTDVDALQTAVTLPAGQPSRFLHIKLISAMGDQDDNIDIARIAVVGYEGERQAEQERALPPSLLTQLGLLKEPLAAFNRVCVDHMRVLSERDCCILWGRDPNSRETTEARTALHDVAASGEFDDRMLFFYFDHSSEDSDRTFAAVLAHSCGCDIGIPLPKRSLHTQHSGDDDDDDDDDEEEDEEEEQAAAGGAVSLEARPVSIVIAQFEVGKSFHYDGPFTPSALRTFVSSFLSGSLSPYVRSQPRPPGDADPAHPGVTVVTGRSWQALVQDSQSDVLELLWRAGEEEDAILLRSVYAVAEVLAGSGSGVLVTVMQMRVNDYPGDDGAAQQLPSLRLLLRDDKSKPLRPPDPPTPETLLTFLFTRCHQPASFPASSPALASATADCLAAFSALKAIKKHRQDVLGVVRGIIPEEEEREVRRKVKEVRRLVLRGADAAALEQAVQHVDAALKDWTAVAEALADGAALVAEVGRSLRDGGIDALSESETKQVLTAAKAVQHYFPDADDDEDDEDEEGDGTEKAAAGDGDEADGERSSKATRPAHHIDAEKLRAATANLREAYSGVKSKLEAHQTELAAQSNGRVVKVHAASELSQHLVAATAAHQLTVIDFTAAWCGPCKAVAPAFGTLSLDWPEVQFLKLDVDECPDVAASFGVEAMPTFVFIREGKEIPTARVKGANVKALSRGIELHSAAPTGAATVTQ